MKLGAFGLIVVSLLTIVALVLFYGLLIMAVWNLVIPDIFHGAPVINFWQGVGLGVLGNLLTASSSPSSSSSK